LRLEALWLASLASPTRRVTVPKMLDTLEKAAIGVIVTAVVTCFGIGAYQGYREHKAEQAQALADQHQGAAQTHAAQAVTHEAEAATHDQQAADLAAKLQAQDEEVARLRAKLARVQAELAAVNARQDGPTAVIPSLPSLPPAGLPVDVVGDVKNELIAAQDRQIGTLKVQVLTLTASAGEWHKSSDQWKAAFNESQAANVQLQAVIAAKNGLIASSLLKGRIQGFVVGVASGYLGGKIK